jgi:hypothetical protein
MPTFWGKPFTPMRLLRIGFRLALVVGIGMGLYSAWGEAVRVSEDKASAERNWSSLRCAARADTNALERLKNPYGLFDISRLGCGNGSGPAGAFLASAAEIEQARRNDRSGMDFMFPFDPSKPFATAIGSWVMVNLVAGLLALAWVIGRWVVR